MPEEAKKDESQAQGSAPVETGAENGLSQALRDEIDEGVGKVMEQVEADRAARAADPTKDPAPKTDVPPGEVPPDDAAAAEAGRRGEKGKGEVPPDGSSAAPDDALVERAVLAGMGLPAAKSFKDAAALERVVGILEKKAKGEAKPTDDGKPADVPKGEEADDPLKDIPDLDPVTYDEAVVKVVKGMKDIIRQQHSVISEFRGSMKDRDATWFNGQVASLGEAYVEAVGNGDRAKLAPDSPQAQRLAALEGKFNDLLSLYKAAGRSVDRGTVFKEAVSIMLADVSAKAEVDRKTKELAARARSHIRRPSGSGVQPSSDALAETAADLDRKYFGKK